MSYWRFAAMIATSTVVMFILMYLNTYLIGHVFWSETRAYMAILMGATMAIVMLAFMMSMYTDKTVNAAIFAGAALAFAGSLWLVRSQVTVGDTSYMRAMIPHHSIAIMTSSRANIEDAHVRKLADEIIYAQDKEIAEMRYMIDRIETSGIDDRARPAPEAPVVSLDQALASAHLPVLDPGFVTADEIARVFPDGAACRFAYTPESPASVVIGQADGAIGGVVKLGGSLVPLPAETGADPATGAALRTEGLSVQITAPDGTALDATAEGWHEADMTYRLEGTQGAGFRGVYRCDA